VVSIFREHTVRRYLNPPSLPHCLTVNSGAVSFDAYHALAVEGSPGTLTFLASNGEVTAANDARRFESVASAFHLPGVPRIELQGTNGPVQLLELYRDDAAASVLDKALNKSSLVGSDKRAAHGKESEGEALASLQEQ
jgi:hypothetical protein